MRIFDSAVTWKCPHGQWMSDGAVYSDFDNCAYDCLPGTYGDSPDLTAPDQCTACPAGTTSPAGSSSKDDCTCPVGSYWKTADECELCPTGTTSSVSDATACTCPLLRYWSKPDECSVCPEGKSSYAVDASECVCPPGTFDALVMDKCEECDALVMDCIGQGFTVATLPVKPSYWRPSNTSLAVGPCYTEGVCMGATPATNSSSSRRHLAEALTLQSSDTYGDGLCRAGHSGPFCEVCLPNYYKQADKLCYDCDSAEGNVGANIAVSVTLVVGVLAIVLIFLCRGRKTAVAELLAGDVTEEGLESKVTEINKGRGQKKSRQAALALKFIGARTRLKIFMSLLQVMSSLGTVFEIAFPPVFSGVMKWIGVLQLDIFTALPLNCVITNGSFHTTLLLQTLVPLGIMLLLGSLGALLLRAGDNKTQKGASRAVLGNILLNFVFFILFFIYPSVSKAIFSTFQCKDIGDGTRYLRADLSINCASPAHVSMMAYAGVMLVIYPFGAPLLYAYLLLRQHGKQLFRLRSIEILRIELAKEAIASDDYDRLAGKSSLNHREDVQSRIDALEAEEKVLTDQLPGYIRTLSGSGAF